MPTKKRTRKNYYKNSPAQKGARVKQRLVLFLKLMAVASVVGFMSFIFIFCYDFITQCNYFEAKTIDVQGLNILSKTQVMEQAEIKIGENILSTNLTVLRASVFAHPWIEDAEVRRELPSTIVIKIKEQIPLAILDLGAKYLVNKSGDIFKKLESEDVHLDLNKLAIVSGLDYSDLNNQGKPQGTSFVAVMNALKLSHDNEFQKLTIKKINVDKELGLTIHLSDQVKTVNLGFNDYSNKYKKLNNILLHLNSQNGFTDIDSIDLKSMNRIVVKPNSVQPPVNQKEV